MLEAEAAASPQSVGDLHVAPGRAPCGAKEPPGATSPLPGAGELRGAMEMMPELF